MKGNPSSFDAIGNRLGFRVAENSNRSLKLIWQGPRFPAYLCLSIAVLLLFVSLPILQAIRLRGFIGPAAALWYFPLMNLILFGIACYLLTLRRTISFDKDTRTLTMSSWSLCNRISLSASYSEIKQIELGIDQVYNGFAVAGSSAAEKLAVPSLRLSLFNGESVLLDRASTRKLHVLGKQISEHLQITFKTDPKLLARVPATMGQDEVLRSGASG